MSVVSYRRGFAGLALSFGLLMSPLCATAATLGANLISVETTDYLDFSTSTQTALAALSDGNTGTGVSTSGTQVGSEVYSFANRFQFDVSGFATITSVTFDFVATLTTDTQIDTLFFGGPFAYYLNSVTAPSGSLVTGSLTVTESSSDALSSFLTGTGGLIFTLSPDAYSVIGSDLTLTTQELSATVTGTLATADVPLPASLPLLLAGLGGLALRRRIAG